MSMDIEVVHQPRFDKPKMESPALLAKVVFITHIVIFLILIILSVYAPILVVVACLVLHRLQIYWFKGCVINHLERKLRKDDHYHFFSELSLQLTGSPLDQKGIRDFDRAVALIVIGGAVGIYLLKRF